MSDKKHMLSEAELAAFCRQLNMIIKAGMPTHYGISILMDEAADEATREFLKKIYDPMEDGCSLYEAMEPLNAFPNYMLHMIALGETTGRLEEVFDSLSVYYEREAQIKQGIRHAIRYPLIMSSLMFVILIVMIREIVPIFANVFAELGGSLSGTAKTLMSISTFLNQYLLSFIIGIIILGLAFVVFSKTKAFKRILGKTSFAQTIATGRFANCMYLALASGLDTDRGLEMASALSDNDILREKIDLCRAQIKNGESFYKAILNSGILSKMHASVITIGAKTGSMDEVMLEISKNYEEESEEKLHRFVSVLEPSLVIVLSFFIGLILVSFLLPLLGIISSIG